MRHPGVQGSNGPKCRRVAVPLSTLLALLHHPDCKDFAAELQLPLNNWRHMDETWQTKEQTDAQAIVARLAALDHCQCTTTSLADLLGLPADLESKSGGPDWHVEVKVPAGMTTLSHVQNAVGQAAIVYAYA